MPAGGRFDGIRGVATGLEIVRALRDAGLRPQHTIEVIDFLAEEPSEYGLVCVGSRGMGGWSRSKMLDLNGPGGEKLRDGLRRVGGDPDKLARRQARATSAPISNCTSSRAWCWNNAALDVGIVTSIVGIRRIEIVFQGEADHAGTTPMALRHDALVAAAHTVASVRRVDRSTGGRRRRTILFRPWAFSTSTLGVEHRSGTVPPDGRRANDGAGPDEALYRGDRPGKSGACDRGARQRAVFTILSDGPPVACDENLRAALRRGARILASARSTCRAAPAMTRFI